MPTYEVTLVREVTGAQYTSLEVEANTREEAIIKALLEEKADDYWEDEDIQDFTAGKVDVESVELLKEY